MRRLFISAIIAMMAISTGLYAQEEDTAQGEPKVNLKVVYERTFDEPIVDVIFGEAGVSLNEAKQMGWREEAFSAEEKSEKTVKIFYPKVVITSRTESIDYPGEPEGEMRAKEIKFYDENGQLTKTVSAGHRLLRSENGRYLVVANLFGDGYDKEGKYIYHPGGGIIYNWDGDEIGKIPSGRVWQVSDNGYVLGEWAVYDSLGREIGLLKPDISEKYLSAEAICYRMSRDGAYIVTTLSMFGPKEAIYILWDKTGRILWKKEFPFEVTGSMPLSHSLIENVGIVGKTWGSIIMVDWDGELLWDIKKPTGGNYRSKFSHNNKKVFMISSSGYVFCFDALAGKILWQHKADWSRTAIANNHPDKKYYYDRLILLKDDEVIAARTLVGYAGPASGVIFIDANNGDLLLEATDYQNVSGLVSKDNILFIIEKHKLTGHVLAGGKK